MMKESKNLEFKKRYNPTHFSRQSVFSQTMEQEELFLELMMMVWLKE